MFLSFIEELNMQNINVIKYWIPVFFYPIFGYNHPIYIETEAMRKYAYEPIADNPGTQFNSS